MQDDEQIGYSGRVDGRTTGRSKWTTGAGREAVPEHKKAWSACTDKKYKSRVAGPETRVEG